jgi:quercetin dioxygenase-like cupin family protein
VVTDDKPLYFGIEVNDQSLVPGSNPRLGSVHFAEWLSKAATLVALFVCGIVFAALSLGHATAADSTTDKSKEAKVTELFAKDMADFPGKEGLMLLIEYPPGSKDPVHRHNAHGFIYVLEGSIIMQIRGGKEVTLTPGQTFYEGPEDVHVVGRNASETEPAKFLVVFVKDKGAPVLVPSE